MAKLTEKERSELKALASRGHKEPRLRNDERYVAPTVEARARYIRFATQASAFYKGEKPVRFEGEHWKL